jgi:hypothetical protein
MDNQPIAGETLQCFNIPVDLGATYHVEVLFDNGCVLSQPITLTNGLNEKFIKQVSVFPNPASKIIQVEYKMGKVKVKVMDINGKVIQQNLESASIHSFNISTLKKGVYLLEISDEVNTCVNIPIPTCC